MLPWMKAADLAKFCNVSTETILKLTKEGKLPAHLIGEQFRYCPGEVTKSTIYKFGDLLNRTEKEIIDDLHEPMTGYLEDIKGTLDEDIYNETNKKLDKIMENSKND